MNRAQLTKLKQLRHRARTDLFWLSTQVLGYDFQHDVHGPATNGFLIQKDRTKSFFEQDSVHQRLWLDPRGHFKTTIDICDVIQWLLNFPDLRILIMTGTEELALRMLKEAKYPFQFNEKLRTLFPEYAAPQADWGTTYEFTVPARKRGHLREPSVSVSTIKSVKAGSHYDIIKCDDLVHENNIGTKELIEKTITAFNYTTPLLEPGGYRDVIGTRYDYSDLYGWMIDSNDGKTRVFKRTAWTIEPDGTKKLLFPRVETHDGRFIGFTLDQLESIRRDDPYLFNCQYLNDPTPTEAGQLTEPEIESLFVPPSSVPIAGRTFITWDLGYSNKSFADYSVGIVGRWDSFGRLFILEMLRGRFTAYELVNGIVNLARKWKPARIGIEKSGGAPLLEPALISACHSQGVYLPLEWLPHPSAHKTERIAGLQSLIRQKKLFFVNTLADHTQIVREFVRFPRYKHDDIPDAIAMQLQFQGYVDYAWPEDKIEIVSAPTFDDGLLGAGLVG